MSDPRWDEAMVELAALAACAADGGRWPDEEPSFRHMADRVLAALADNGLLLTPRMAEVLEAAKAAAEPLRLARALTRQSLIPTSAALVAAVDAWEASRDH